MESKNEVKKPFSSETLLIFLVPVYAYLLVYAHEFGYFYRLGIPAEFIEIRLASMAGLSLLFAFNFFFIIGVLNIIYKLVRRGKDAVGESLVQLYIVALFIFLPALAFDFDLGLILLAVVPMGLLLLLRFLYPVIKHRKIKGYWNKVEAEYKKEHQPEDEHILGEVRKRIGLSMFRLSLLLVSFLIIAFFLGAVAAKKQKTFLVINTTPEQVVLRKSQASLLCAEFDREKKELLHKFRLLALADVSRGEYMMTQEKVGPLSKPMRLGKK
jgi:hypothetical protein